MKRNIVIRVDEAIANEVLQALKDFVADFWPDEPGRIEVIDLKEKIEGIS